MTEAEWEEALETAAQFRDWEYYTYLLDNKESNAMDRI